MNIALLLADLGIRLSELERRGLCRCEEAADLELVQVDADGRQHLLTPLAARYWKNMAESAKGAGIELLIVSAFRSVERQAEIFHRKMALGLSINDILTVSAPPGYSEHHTGMAVDVGVTGDSQLERSFENTEAFAWLKANAGVYGFRLSYPEGNSAGYAYEPWHWCYKG